MSQINAKRKRKIVKSLETRDGHFCHYCGIPLDDSAVTHDQETNYGRTWVGGIEYAIIDGQRIKMSRATIDHKIPQSQDGGNSIDNLVLSCLLCNMHKSARYSYEEFIKI